MARVAALRSVAAAAAAMKSKKPPLQQRRASEKKIERNIQTIKKISNVFTKGMEWKWLSRGLNKLQCHWNHKCACSHGPAGGTMRYARDERRVQRGDPERERDGGEKTANYFYCQCCTSLKTYWMLRSAASALAMDVRAAAVIRAEYLRMDYAEFAWKKDETWQNDWIHRMCKSVSSSVSSDAFVVDGLSSNRKIMRAFIRIASPHALSNEINQLHRQRMELYSKPGKEILMKPGRGFSRRTETQPRAEAQWFSHHFAKPIALVRRSSSILTLSPETEGAEQ